MKNLNNNTMNSVPYPFPKTLNIREWQWYLGRRIDDEEYSLMESLRYENSYNRDLRKLFEIISKKNLYIPQLTSHDGNCLFESFSITGLCKNRDDFRKFLAYMMYLYKDHKNFFSYDQRTLKEMFNDTNEVEYVLCCEEVIVYKYTFETMCQDFANGSSWTRLPTQIIIQFISTLMNVRIEIFSNMNEYITILDPNINSNSDRHTIYLGHLGEKHYVPLKLKIGELGEEICPKYSIAKKRFIEWAILMERSINAEYMTDIDNNEDNKDNEDNHPPVTNINTEKYVEITKPSNNFSNRVEFD